MSVFESLLTQQPKNHIVVRTLAFMIAGSSSLTACQYAESASNPELIPSSAAKALEARPAQTQIPYVVVLRSDHVLPALRRSANRRQQNDQGKSIGTGHGRDRRLKAERVLQTRMEVENEVDDIAAKYGIIPTHTFAVASTGFAALLTEEGADELARAPEVEAVIPDEMLLLPQDEAATQVFPCSDLSPYFVDRAVSYAGGPVNRTSSDDFIWVVDSGIDLDHPDLNVVSAPYAFQFGGGPADDDFGHGTMVAGIAAAKYDSTGISGVSAGAQVVPVKVMFPGIIPGTYGAQLSVLLAGLDHVGTYNVEGDVVNLSLIEFDASSCANQSTGRVKTLRDALLEISFEGTWVVSGAGNAGMSVDMCTLADRGFPACIDGFHILTTSSVDLSTQDIPGCGSHGWGATTDYATIGSQATLYKNGQCAFTNGTSMATAVLSGIVFGRSISSTVPASGAVSCCGRTEPIANLSVLSTLQFDIELELKELSFGNVRDIDGGEDLYGNFRFRRLSTDSRVINSTLQNMWSRSEATAGGSVGFPNGVRNIGSTHTIGTNISYFDLLTSKFKVSADLKDDEGFFPSRTFTCTNCNADSNSAREFDLSSLPNATASIQSLALTSPTTSQLLSLGTSDYVTMTFAENGNTSDGYVTSRWRLRVRPH